MGECCEFDYIQGRTKTSNQRRRLDRGYRPVYREPPDTAGPETGNIYDVYIDRTRAGKVNEYSALRELQKIKKNSRSPPSC